MKNNNFTDPPVFADFIDVDGKTYYLDIEAVCDNINFYN